MAEPTFESALQELGKEEFDRHYRQVFGKPVLDFTMDGTPCNCTGSPILSKKAHSFRGGMNCDQ